MKPAECLEGLTLNGGWVVQSIIKPMPQSTGGHFSVGYLVKGQQGQEAFLKALDVSSAFQRPDPLRELQAMTSAFNFERDLLAKCKSRKLHRISTPIADGVVDAPGNHGALRSVFYLIFELAAGDLRTTVAQLSAFDLAWTLRTMHETTIGLRQLHSVGIAHQDLKPSNVLIYDGTGARLADLGRASDMDVKSAIDNCAIPGDRGYATPEQIYGWRLASDFSHRFISDLYHLGSMLHFLFGGIAASHALNLQVSRSHNRAFTSGDFLSDLPYLEHAFGIVLRDLRIAVTPVAGDLTDEILLVAEQLCQPDPRLRGDPRVRSTVRPQHDLQLYISKFDRLAKLAELRVR